VEGCRISATGERFNQRLKGDICSNCANACSHSVYFASGMASAELQESAPVITSSAHAIPAGVVAFHCNPEQNTGHSGEKMRDSCGEKKPN